MKKLLTLFAVLALASFGLAACGSDDSDSTSSDTESSAPADTTAASGGGETVDISADPDGNLAWTQDQVSAKAGAATIQLTNDSSVTHDLVVEDSDGNELGEAEDVTGGTSQFDTDLKPGSYTFYCSIPGHREAGMEGTLTVK